MSEKLKHVTDLVAVCGGFCASLNHWLIEIVNPILTALVSLATLIWLYYRIQAFRKGKKEKAEE